MQLMLSGKDGLEETLFSGQTAHGVVSFGGETNGTREGKGNRFTSVATFGIDFTNVQLDSGMILRGNKAVSSRAIIWGERKRESSKEKGEKDM